MHLSSSVQLTLFSGKGGVGKTTCACGFARQLARQVPHQSVMLLSADPAHSLGDVLQMPVTNVPKLSDNLGNLKVRSLDAKALLEDFRAAYGDILELLVERGSFVEDDDLSPLWDMGWPGLDELMALLEIERILREHQADWVVVDMAPSGHTLNLFALMDFLDTLLASLEQFQAKHRYMIHALSGHYTPDRVDEFIKTMQRDLAEGRALLQDSSRTACWIVAIPEPMSLAESHRFQRSLQRLQIPVGGVIVNRLDRRDGPATIAQQPILQKFQSLMGVEATWGVPLQFQEPVGSDALDQLMEQLLPLTVGSNSLTSQVVIQWPEPVTPGFQDFVACGRRLVLVGGKGGVGKTTVAAAIGWHLACCHPQAAVRVVSIDPAHSLGDAFEQDLSHEPMRLSGNLSAQEVNARVVLDQFREEYLWELADMISGDRDTAQGLQIAYGPEAWRQIVAQALPGIDEMLSLITIVDLLEQDEQQIIVLDTAPTGHLLRFLAMPTALGDWLAWIFRLWIKYKDVVGRVDLISRLRTLRKRVMDAQAKLQDPQHTEFIGVVQDQTAILSEAWRLNRSLQEMGLTQNYVVHNRYRPGEVGPARCFTDQKVVCLPELPANATPFEQVKGAAELLFVPEKSPCLR